MYACFGVTRHLPFWQDDRGRLHATVETRGLERTPNNSQHTKLTLEKTLFPPFLPGLETRNLSITSPALYLLSYSVPAVGVGGWGVLKGDIKRDLWIDCR